MVGGYSPYPRRQHGDTSLRWSVLVSCGAMLRTTGGRWYLWLTLLSVAGTVAPVVWILAGKLHAHPTGDAWYFHYQASLIANGAGWFISPLPYLFHHQVVQSAQHPPLWVLVLALFDVLGIQSYPAQLLAACVIGGSAVFMTGLAAREVGGTRTGLVAAAIAAVYPNYWINYGLGLSETVILVLTGAVILVSVKLWRRPSLPMVVVLGLLCGLAAATRAEQVLLILVVLVPLILLLKGVALLTRVQYIAVGVVVALVVIVPWAGFNLSRFSHATFLSNDSGTALAMANCRSAYYKAYIGSGDFNCLDKIKPVPGDESAQDAHNRHVALKYINGHIGRLPVVLLARPARELGFYRPLVQLKLENDVNGRPLVLGEIGLGMYYVLAVAGIYGAVVLRRRGITLVPFIGIFVELVVAAMLTFGETRYRAPMEVVLVVLASVAFDSLLTRSRPGHRGYVRERPAQDLTNVAAG
jgi:4-amino-4-deoxy-L-arabinose transferase-like glycosyltransferase